MKKLMFVVNLLLLQGVVFCMERKRQLDIQITPEETKKVKSDLVTVSVEDVNYEIQRSSFARSGTLAEMAQDFEIANEVIPLINVTTTIWKKYILPALDTGERYQLPENIAYNELVEIINQANYLNIPYLTQNAIIRSSNAIKNNIDQFGSKPKIFDDFIAFLPPDIEEELAQDIFNKDDFLIPVELENPSHGVSQVEVAFSPDGKYMATGYIGGIDIWDVTQKKRVRSLRRNKYTDDDLNCFAFNPDGTQICAVYSRQNSRVVIWDLSQGMNKAAVYSEDEFRDESVFSIAYSPDGTKIALGCPGKIILLNNQVNNEGKKTRYDVDLKSSDPRHLLVCRSLAWSSDGKTVAAALSGGNESYIAFVDAPTTKTTYCNSKRMNTIAFRPNSTQLFSGGEDDGLYVWDCADLKKVEIIKIIELGIYRGHTTFSSEYPITSMAFNHDGTKLLCGGFKYLGLLNLSYGLNNPIYTSLKEKTDFTSVAWRPDQRFVASGSDDGMVSLWRFPFNDSRPNLLQTIFIYYSWKHKKIDTENPFYKYLTDQQKADLKNIITLPHEAVIEKKE